MADLTITIGGRDFEVACRDGEEHFLQSAAGMLDNEAGALNEALGRMPETRMLLMAGLMLADKTASLEDQLKAGAGAVEDAGFAKRAAKAETQLSETQAELAEVKAMLAESQAEVKKAIKRRNDAVETLNDMVGKVETVAKAIKKAG
jgi:cell division protein ZapA